MAKPLKPSNKLIRETIQAHPSLGNPDIAELINNDPARDDDDIRVTANEVYAQRQAMAKLGTLDGSPAKASGDAPQAVGAGSARPAASDPVALLRRVLDLAEECGGVKELKNIVDGMDAISR